MYYINKCILCKSEKFTPQFSKPSGSGQEYTLVKCNKCGLKFLSQAPDEKEIEKYYTGKYFQQRTDRGYNNYFSNVIRCEIERVLKLNLLDLGFYEFEKRLSGQRYSLDIGCAAGYFVSYLKERGWNSRGVDISGDCIVFAAKSGLDVVKGDYLNIDFSNKFNLITLWSTLEHLHRPDLVLEKAYSDLEHSGMLYISTCRVDGMNFMKLFGQDWRFYNFPEHIYFFSYNNLKNLLRNFDFKVTGYRTYGSNIGRSGSRKRKIADFIAKKFYLGDMMILSAKKVS